MEFTTGAECAYVCVCVCVCPLLEGTYMFEGILMCDTYHSVLLLALKMRQPLSYSIHFSSLPLSTVANVLFGLTFFMFNCHNIFVTKIPVCNNKSLLVFFSVFCHPNQTQFNTTKGNAAIIDQRYKDNKI